MGGVDASFLNCLVLLLAVSGLAGRRLRFGVGVGGSLFVNLLEQTKRGLLGLFTATDGAILAGGPASQA